MGEGGEKTVTGSAGTMAIDARTHQAHGGRSDFCRIKLVGEEVDSLAKMMARSLAPPG